MAATDHRRRTWGIVGGLVAIVLAATAAPPAAHADNSARIAQLTEVFDGTHVERDRVAAATALARLGDKAAMRALVTALRDPSPAVRGIAASGLGKLAHRAALPALRQAQADADAVVQKRVAEAIVQICTANKLPVQAAPTTTVAPVTVPASSGTTATAAGTTPRTAGFGDQPRAVAPRPDVYVVIKSASDDSPGKYDKRARKVHAEAMRDAMVAELAGDALVTVAAADAKKYGLDSRHLDLSVIGLELRTDATMIEVEAQLRLAVSDQNGKMLSFVSGGAKVQVPRRGFDVSYLPQLRREALENAVRGLFGKLIDQLRRSLTS